MRRDHAGLAKGSEEGVVCRSCGAAFASPPDLDGRSLRCASCGAAVGAPAGGAVAWVYPLRSRPELSATTRAGATLDPEARGAPDLDGVRFAGRYELRSELGSGGMGVVYRAWDPELGRNVALKVLTAGRFASSEARTRFLAEARTAAAVTHPGIVRVLDMGSQEGRPFFTMEEIRGPSLEDVVTSFALLDPREAARITLQVARAVQHAHEHGVVHRDLKPGNILLTTRGEALVTDFGIAKGLDSTLHLTATRDLLGTPGYLAPEVAAGGGDPSWIAVDVYGLGAVLYAALTGRAPVSGAATLAQALDLAARGEIVPVRTRRPDVPEALAAVVHRALHLDPTRRYRTAAELGDDLARFLAGEPVVARPEGTAEKAVRLVRRHRVALSVAGLLAVAIAGAVAVPRVQERLAAQAREAAAERAWAAVGARVQELVERGEPDEAHAAIQRFVDTQENQGTLAAFRASMSLGDLFAPEPRTLAMFDDERALDAWARALQDAPTDATRFEALLRVGGWLADHDRPADLRPILDRLEALDTGGAHELDIVPLRLRWALHTGRKREAVEAWERARALHLPAALAYADPRRLPAALQGARRLAILPGTSFVPGLARLPSGETGVEIAEGPEVRHATLEPGAPPAGSGTPWTDLPVFADVDGDGVVEGYRREAGRPLLRIRDGVEGPLPGEGRGLTTSEISGVAAGDLDGDGDPELVVGGSEWHTYDLRVLDGDGRGGLRLRAREHRNVTDGVVTIPDPWNPGRALVASTETDIYPSRRVFGEAQAGPPGGVLIRRLEGDELRTLFFWPGTGTRAAADVDGDGTVELLLGTGAPGLRSARFTVVVWTGDEPDTFRVSILPHFLVVGALQLDGDPEDELVANVWRDGRAELWVLNAGTEALPAFDPVAPLGEDLRAGAAGGEAASWATLRLVREAGLLRQAAAGFERLSRTSEAAVGAAAAREAARTWAVLRRPGRAAAAWERAAGLAPGEERAADLEQATRAWLDALDPGRALDAADAWRAADGRGPTGELADVLAAWAASRRSRHTYAGGIAEALEVADPLAVRVLPDRLQIDVRGPTPVVQVPLQPPAGPVLVSARIDVGKAEWASALRTSLVAGEPQASVTLGIIGGGRTSFLDSATWILGHFDHRPLPLLPGNQVALVRLAWTPWDRRWTTFVELPSHDQAWSASYVAPAPPEGPWSLQLAHGSAEKEQWMEAHVRDLEIWGAGVAPVEGERHRGNLALARWQPREALPLVAKDDVLAQALAHLQVGDLEATIADLRRADAAGELAPRASQLLRVRPERWSRLVRSALGPERFTALFAEVWGDAPVQDEATQRALIEDVEGLDLSRFPALAARRALALLHAGQVGRGEVEARRWLASHTERTPELAELASQLHRRLAVEAAERGDLESARAAALASVEEARWPAVARDRLRIEPALAAIGDESAAR